MGISSDGILAFGVDLGEPDDVELPWASDGEDDDGEFEEWYVGLHGVTAAHLWDAYNAWAETPEALAIPGHSGERLKAYEAAHPAWREELDAYYEKKHEIEGAAPIEIVQHCSYDYPMYIVAVPGTVTTAYRGSPEKIPDFDVDSAKVAAAGDFCAAHGIPFDNPGWLLASMYG